ncbi:uncharacterized protein LOC134773237 isoform X2 [Penaeus indicus]|uniref:uncharacterized protein LOC134773237 isoform X2 n=1 Tax=Penaeus indicus TaxID=29960 RepID=UPI00300CC223
MFLTRVPLVLALLPCVVWAQLGTLAENSTLGSCECSPACEDTVGAGGCRGRLVARADCPCCKVCAQHEGKACAEPTLPCDAEFGLYCSPEGVCKAEFPCVSDGECPQDRFCLGGVCVDPCPILTPCLGVLKGGQCVSKEHRPVCECPEGTIANSADDVCISVNDTKTGCEHDGRLYAVGETRYLGKCEEQCRCGADGKFSCGPVACAPGLFPAGQHSQEELCIELRNRPDTDECCVVVACVNSLTRPSLLTSPASSPLTLATEEEQPLAQAVRALSGRTAGGDDLAEPITEEEYQRRLKDLEHELNKNSKKKAPFEKPTEKPAVEELTSPSSVDSLNATAADGVESGVDVTEELPQDDESVVDVTEEIPQDDESLAEVTTTIPQTPDEKGEPAVIVEIDHHGEEIHRITVQEAVDVVTVAAAEEEATTMTPTQDEGAAPEESVGEETVSSIVPAKEEEAVTSAVLAEGEDAPTPAVSVEEGTTTEMSVVEMPADKKEDATHMNEESTPADKDEETTSADRKEEGTPVEEEEVSASPAATAEEEEGLTTEAAEEVATTTAAPAEGEEVPVSFREAKKAPEETNITETVAEEPIRPKEKDPLAKGSVGGLKVIATTHNSSTVLLPSTKGGEIYYKPHDSEDWQRMTVQAGEDSLALKGLVPGTHYNVKWSGVSGGSAKESLDTLEGCQAENASYGVGQEWTEGCQKKCSCSPGGVAKCEPRCRFVAGQGDPSCTEIPDAEDPECCVICKGTDPERKEGSCTFKNTTYRPGDVFYDECDLRCTCNNNNEIECKPRCEFSQEDGSETEPGCEYLSDPKDSCCKLRVCNSTSDAAPSLQQESAVSTSLTSQKAAGMPKLLVTSKTHSSVTLAWDDFRARAVEEGYVAEYREVEGVTASEEQPWMKKIVPVGATPPSLTSVTIEDLKPNTMYQVRVSIYDEVENGRLADTTETLTVRTESGCVYGNSSHPLGEFFIGCEERCTCHASGDVRCFQRCTLPYFKKGEFSGDALCREQTAERDSCCVIVRCATNTSNVALTNLPYEPCTNMVCGPNAECEADSMTSDDPAAGGSNLSFAKCRCLPGYVGDASDLDIGCVLDPERKEGSCTFKNTTYRPGDVFYDECDYRCSCNNNNEIECEPRCEFPHEDGSETEPGCEYLPDPKDSCCKLRVCNSTSEAATDAARAPSLPSNGCTEGNITYAMNERYYNGCETQCTCMGFGDISCVPRCPPLKVVSETPKRCETLPDPLDPCCSITVCDDETPDVMKANLTDEERKMLMENMTGIEKVMTMKEMMKNMTEVDKEIMINNMTVEEREMLVNMTTAERKMMNKTMSETEKDMVMQNIMDLERDMMEKNMTEVEMEMMMKNKTAMGKNAHNHSHVHEDGTHSHSHDHETDGAHAGHAHFHTHEDGTNHSHAHGNMEHAPDGGIGWHVHEDGTNHSHAHESSAHTHGGDWHVHEDGTNHSHPHGNMKHTHEGEDIWHVHEDGTNHSHPLGDKPHSHTSDGEIVWHTEEEKNMGHSHEGIGWHVHEDGTNHSHVHGNMDHTHENGTWHVHEDGTNHSHAHGNMKHTHEDVWHVHEDGTNHSHPHGDKPHSHTDDGEIIWHTQENDTMDHIHGTNDWHVHEDGTNHSHDSMPHTHGEDEWHVHEDGTNHSHAHGSMPHTHGKDEWHVHEDGTNHSHAHGSMPHTHGKDEWHVHEDGTNHSHAHDSMGHSHDEDVWHVHEDGTNHSHPHGDKPHSHAGDGGIIWHSEDENNMAHTHGENDWHVHKDGTNHSHVHDNMGHTHDEDVWHVHEDGTNHSHPHGDKPHSHTADGEIVWHTEEDDIMTHTHLGVLEKKSRANDEGSDDLSILNVTAINATAAEIHLAVSDAMLEAWTRNPFLIVLYSPDSFTWSKKNISSESIRVQNPREMYVTVGELQPSTAYQFRVQFYDTTSSTAKVQLLDGPADLGVDIDVSNMCEYEGHYYKRGENFYQGCRQSCMCSENLEVYCANIECPVSSGLDIIDPNCLEWDIDPDFVLTPPNCCQPLKCVSSAACEYMGQTFNNHDIIPREITGCSQQCTCNYGEVSCHELCPPMPETPPPELQCPPEKAVPMTQPGETCCRSWQCAAHTVADFEFLATTEVVETTQYAGSSQENGIAEPVVQPLDARTAQVSFNTPPVYKGLPGELLVRFTSDPVANSDPATWKKEILVPMGTIINHSQWNHVMTSLEPGTSYAMQVVLSVQGAQPVTSPMFTYITMAEATTPSTTTPLPRLEVNADLYAVEIAKTTAKISWRRFNEYELQYIDGVQVKYSEKDKLIPIVSSLLHHDSNQMELRDLQPGTEYIVDLVLFPHENQSTEISNTKPINFRTLPEEDPYEFEIEVHAGKVSSQTAELYYSGVPDPEEKYVNVFRAVYVREDERVDAQTFKIPKTGQEKKIFLGDLKPDVEYNVWLEAYLSNGRKKKSNVIPITTKAGELPKPEKSEVDPSTQADGEKDGYYAALVAVAIIAAIACVGFLGLLVILLRKQSHAKAHINSSRNNAAYDNPSYKTYDMEMNGIKGSGNGATHMDEP